MSNRKELSFNGPFKLFTNCRTYLDLLSLTLDGNSGEDKCSETIRPLLPTHVDNSSRDEI